MPPQEASRSSATRRRRTAHNTKQPFISKLLAQLRNRIFELAMPSDVQLDTSERPVNLTQFARKNRIYQRIRLERSGSDKRPAQTREQVQAQLERVSKQDVRDFLEVSRNRPPIPITPAITQVCKALRLETLGIFYGSNIFQLRTPKDEDPEITERWLANVPHAGLTAIRRIVVTNDFRATDNVELHISLDLNSGDMRFDPLPDREDWTESDVCLACMMAWRSDEKVKGDHWSPEAIISKVERGYYYRIKMSAPLLLEKQGKARRLYGLGNGEEMTAPRLAKIVKLFDFNKGGPTG